jgi:hypothetical protein
MKNLFLITSMLFATFIMSCDGSDNQNLEKVAYQTKEGRFDMAQNNFITMRVSPESVFIDESIKLIIENHSAGDLLYSQPFALEYLDGEIWTPVQLEINFEDIGIILRAGETVEKVFFVSKEHFQKLGKYRIVKHFVLYSDFPTEIDSDFNLYAELEVKIK